MMRHFWNTTLLGEICELSVRRDLGSYLFYYPGPVATGPAGLRPRDPLPEEEWRDKVQVQGMPAVRAWGGMRSAEVFTEFAQESVRQEQAAYGKDNLKKPVSFLGLVL